MSEKRWVQHISGQGEKWEIQKYQDPEWPSWVAPHTVNGGGVLYLPKSEYRLCEPPEVWRDVTEEVDVRGGLNKSGGPMPNEFVYHKTAHLANLVCGGAYRLRKVQLETPHKCGKTLASIVWAFIVEQKVTQ